MIISSAELVWSFKPPVDATEEDAQDYQEHDDGHGTTVVTRFIRDTLTSVAYGSV